MADDLTLWRNDRLLSSVILLVGLHSCALGSALLIAPRFALAAAGFADPDSIFFPSQSGIFLLILSFCYLRALTVPSFVWTILVSKTLAVAFLLVHLMLPGTRPILWLAAAGDATMLAAVVFALRRHRRGAPAA